MKVCEAHSKKEMFDVVKNGKEEGIEGEDIFTNEITAKIQTAII